MTKPSACPPLIVTNPEDGFLRIGMEKSTQKRKSQCQLASGSACTLRLFKDGGWEIKSQTNSKGSNIIQKGTGPLNIKSEGDLNIDVDGTFNVKAKDIVMETTDADVGDIVLNPKHDFRLDAKNYVILMGKDVTIDAVSKLILFSQDMSYLIGRYVRIHEPTSQLIPPTFGAHIKELTDTLIN
tara:strand:- start:497 stop:1045 length:549 start_codon:yes stop_codon:yes gene_type:complete